MKRRNQPGVRHCDGGALPGSRAVVPDCGNDFWHDPPGAPVPAAYFYTYRDEFTGLSGYGKVLCVPCCARMRMLSLDPPPGVHAPPATKITVLRDANTGEPVI